MAGYGGVSRPKSVTWADPVDDCGGLGGDHQKRAAAAAAEAKEEGKFWSSGGGGGRGVGGDTEDDTAGRGFQIGAVHVLKKQVGHPYACLRLAGCVFVRAFAFACAFISFVRNML